MAKQKFGLGRGLDALLPGASEVNAQLQTSRIDENAILEAAIDSIIPNPRQPRRVFPENDPKLLELSDSIKEHGLLQPLVVTRLSNTGDSGPRGDAWFGDEETNASPPTSRHDAGLHFQLIAGERRWRASRLAGLTRVPVVIKEVTPQQMLELALIENIQRADLNPIEEALAYQELVQEFNLTQEQVAKQVGKNRATVANAIRLLQLPARVRDALINQSENFTEGHARTLIGINREEDLLTAFDKIIALHLNVRQAEELSKSIKDAQAHKETHFQTPAPAPRRNPDLEALERRFRDSLMVKVALKCNAKGEGTLVLHFNNQEELDRLYGQLVTQAEAEA